MFGFSDHGKLAGSDFCLYNNAGDGQLIDGYLGVNLEPKIDVHQDCNLISFDKHNGHLVFRRKFTTCDIRDYAVENITQKQKLYSDILAVILGIIFFGIDTSKTSLAQLNSFWRLVMEHLNP
uniref:DOMON domain-containing protein n=1 Tax=Panagrolaimus superbus TaxID=310955 RepID=A0A914YDY7_9BILA